MIAEYVNGSLSKEYIYSGGTLIATHNAGTLKYHHNDHPFESSATNLADSLRAGLSMRVTTNTSGSVTATSGTKIGEQGHYPYGESWYSQSTTTKFQFTSYERDAESGNDYAMFRSHVSRLGRFSSPDPLAHFSLDSVFSFSYSFP